MAEARPAPPGMVPWSERLVAAAPVPPLVLAAAIAAALFALFLLIELTLGNLGAFLRGQAPRWQQEEYRFSLVFSLLIGYVPAAYAYAVAGSRRTLDALRPSLGCSAAEFAQLREGAGRVDARSLRIAGLVGMGVALAIPFFVDLTLSTYDVRELHAAVVSHRVFLVVAGWLVARFVHAILVDSMRLARIGREFFRVDLLDLSSLAPLTRHGLRNALLCVGILSILSLLLVDWSARRGLPIIITAGLVLTVALAAAGFLLPLRGVHGVIRDAKRIELAWCQEEIRRHRATLGEGSGADRHGAGGLADVVAYRGFVESVPEWPFDAPTLARFALYVAIPLGSWLGGAMVERLVDDLLR